MLFAIWAMVSLKLWLKMSQGPSAKQCLLQQLQQLSEPRKRFVSAFRGGIMLYTCIGILAVDFHAFPRRYAKAENYGQVRLPQAPPRGCPLPPPHPSSAGAQPSASCIHQPDGSLTSVRSRFGDPLPHLRLPHRRGSWTWAWAPSSSRVGSPAKPSTERP